MRTSLRKHAQYPVKSSWVYEHVYGGDINFDTIKRESIELIHAFPNIQEMKEEFIQVYINWMVFLYKHIGLDIYLYGGSSCIQVYLDRFEVWEYILGKFGKDFSIEYMREGSNWTRPEKVISILSKAGIYITNEKALDLIDEVQRLRFK